MKKDCKVPSFPFWVTVLMTRESPKERPTSTPSTSTIPYSSSPSFYMVLKLMVFVIIPFLLSCFIVTASSSCNQLGKDSLWAFYSNLSMSSNPPLNWSTSDCCNWEGIVCDASDDNGDQRVIQLLLPSRGLSGSISSSLTNLTNLSTLNLSHNRFSGILPAQFFSLLNHLQILDLSYNRLSGELPPFDANINSSSTVREMDLSSNIFQGTIPSSVLANLAAAAAGGSLTSFNISNNGFTGQIPISFFCINENNSSSVRFLDFSFNEFSGNIPRGLGPCSKLEKFQAGFNSLSGNIPSDVFDATALQVLSLPLNELSGTIDNGIVSLANLTVLDLYSNLLSGSIPQDIGKLSSLVQLQLHINNLTGTLPPSLSNCINLVILNLRVNSLGGNLSEFNFSRLVRLTTLDLGNNNFTGNLPPTLYACKSLSAVRLAANQLEGQISPGILELHSLSFLSIDTNNLRNFMGALRILTGLKNLTTLTLSKNFFGEMILHDLNIIGPDDFQELQILALGGCNFTGRIPAWLSRLNKLEVVDLSYNQLTGSIPPWLGTLPRLFYLDLSVNLITGVFPIELTRLPALTSQQVNGKVERTYLELPLFVAPTNASVQQYNKPSNLPPAIYLGNNIISGSIPIEIGQLKVLNQLYLNHNNFSGNIPVQISNLTNLERLDLSGNRLSGEIPASLKSLHFLSYFSVANNDLRGEIPNGGQFDTFTASSFEGNPRLCGSAVQRSCPNQPTGSSADHRHTRSKKSLILGLVLAVSFGTVFIISLLILWILVQRDHKSRRRC
ncbi:hypothetical protein L6164_021312 [Bauhinia variegata]|uniref:Uncharacterized protein n=1 Tax=Bauhinia variegata TaxID=167791 RepID=A0ACB9MXX6_BAUVA|nr:hypothetical protein L6164_021312 [Bauhinia variegata]